MLPIFSNHPEEAKIVGRLLTAYSDLEIGLMNCVIAACRDFDRVYKDMYRTKGELARIKKAKELWKNPFNNVVFDKYFSKAIGGVDYCRLIRNQFAHCAWDEVQGEKISFVDLRKMALNNENFKDIFSLPRCNINLALLKKQHSYFEYVDGFLGWLHFEIARKNRNSFVKNPWEFPKGLKRPPLNIS